MIYFLIITALTVSIDSFFCGFSLSLKGGKKTPIIIGITLTVFVMCVITNYLAILLSPFLSEKTACLGGAILIGVGIYNLLKKDKSETQYKSVLSEVLISGFAVGLDGAIANLSLSLMGINAFYVPITIAIAHALTITLGVLSSKLPAIKSFGKIEFIPPFILILLGGYKLLGLFI